MNYIRFVFIELFDFKMMYMVPLESDYRNYPNLTLRIMLVRVKEIKRRELPFCL